MISKRNFVDGFHDSYFMHFNEEKVVDIINDVGISQLSDLALAQRTLKDELNRCLRSELDKINAIEIDVFFNESIFGFTPPGVIFEVFTNLSIMLRVMSKKSEAEVIDDHLPQSKPADVSREEETKQL